MVLHSERVMLRMRGISSLPNFAEIYFSRNSWIETLPNLYFSRKWTNVVKWRALTTTTRDLYEVCKPGIRRNVLGKKGSGGNYLKTPELVPARTGRRHAAMAGLSPAGNGTWAAQRAAAEARTARTKTWVPCRRTAAGRPLDQASYRSMESRSSCKQWIHQGATYVRDIEVHGLHAE